MTRSSFTASFALIGLALLAAAGSAKAQNDIAVGSLAQCWKATVRINTMMETGTLTPPLTGDQVQALYKAVAARDREDYGACVELLKTIPNWDK